MNAIKKSLPVTLSLLLLGGCGAGGDEPDMGAALSAVGGSVTAPLTTDTNDSDNDSGNNLPTTSIEVEDTKSLIVSDDFTFSTAQHINIDFDIESARGTDASVSICTSYSPDNSDYDIDYNSCTVQGTMLDGKFTHKMEVTNEFRSVVAVVWFQDESIAPVYQEFSVAGFNSERSARLVNGEKVIVWR